MGGHVDHSVNAPLRDNVRLLGDLLGECLRQQAGDGLFDTIEQIRQALYTRSESGAPLTSFDLLSPLDDDTLPKWPERLASSSISATMPSNTTVNDCIVSTSATRVIREVTRGCVMCWSA